MAKRKPRPVVPPKDDRVVITIDPRAIESKVRKPLPPTTRAHRDKTRYRRKPKHPSREDAS